MSWRSTIINQFVTDIKNITLVADPDGLLLEEKIQSELRENGFELVTYEDPIAFRYEYELKFRQYWDREEKTDLVIALRAERDDLDNLPYDLLQKGRCLHFSLSELFPDCQIGVIELLDKSSLETLDKALKVDQPGPMGTNPTMDFVSRHLYQFDAATLNTPALLLSKLLNLHYNNITIPTKICDRLVEQLNRHETLQDWPLSEIISSHTAFFTFLQERWSIYLDNLNPGYINESNHEYGLKIEGPVDLPFEHSDVKVILDDCFREGLLEPIEYDGELKEDWIKCGVKSIDSIERLYGKIKSQLEAMKNQIPDSSTIHQDWIQFSVKYSKWLNNWSKLEIEEIKELHKIKDSFENELDSRFIPWVKNRYSGLHSLPANNPVMVHHIPRMIANHLNKNSKQALIVLDGCSLAQWYTTQEIISEIQTDLSFSNKACFSWLPSLTNVSRQAIFSGKIPLHFSSSINATSKEPKLWENFWVEYGVKPNKIFYKNKIRHQQDVDLIFEKCDDKYTILGLVLDEVDEIMHGQRQGTYAMHQQIRTWTKGKVLINLLNGLLEKGFNVHITADHGNVETKGIGVPREGILVDKAGQRVRVYHDKSLMQTVLDAFPDSYDWNAPGLPKNFFTVFPPKRTAYVEENESPVCHGGISLEEMVVPLVQVSKGI